MAQLTPWIEAFLSSWIWIRGGREECFLPVYPKPHLHVHIRSWSVYEIREMDCGRLHSPKMAMTILSILYVLSEPCHIHPLSRSGVWGFPGGAVVKNPPANVGNTGSSPGLGRSHMLQSNWAHAPQLLSLWATTTEPVCHNYWNPHT